jgi:hypothetical protein
VETLFVIQHLPRAPASHGTVSGDKKGGTGAPPLSFALPLAARRLDD